MIVTLTPLRTSYFPYLTSFNLHNKCIRQVLGLPLSIFQTLGKLGKLTKSQTANKQLEQNQNPGFLQAPGASHCVISSIFLFHFFFTMFKEKLYFTLNLWVIGKVSLPKTLWFPSWHRTVEQYKLQPKHCKKPQASSHGLHAASAFNTGIKGKGRK